MVGALARDSRRPLAARARKRRERAERPESPEKNSELRLQRPKVRVTGLSIPPQRLNVVLALTVSMAVTLALTAVYVMIMARAAPAGELQLSHRLHILLNFVCIYTVAMSSGRFRGALDQRLAKVFATALFVHGMFALLILAGRLFWSRPVLVLSFLVSLAAGALIVLLRQRSAPRVALVGPVVDEAIWAGVKGDRIRDPAVNLSSYDIVLVAFDGPVSTMWTKALARAMLSGCQARHVGEYLEEMAGAVSIDDFELDHVSDRNSAFYRPLKRFLDISITLAVLPIALPLVLLSAAAILLTMGWPVFFVQQRIGLGGAPCARLARTPACAPPCAATCASPLWAASYAAPASTNCRSSGTCCAAT